MAKYAKVMEGTRAHQGWGEPNFAEQEAREPNDATRRLISGARFLFPRTSCVPVPHP
jgi:hypothetical protein